jgi:hypothetical protein
MHTYVYQVSIYKHNLTRTIDCSYIEDQRGSLTTDMDATWPTTASAITAENGLDLAGSAANEGFGIKIAAAGDVTGGLGEHDGVV